MAAAPHAGVLAILLALGIALMWGAWGTGHPTSSVLCGCGDPGQTVWFLEWVPWALGHGHNPLLTETMFAGQGGANLLESTSYLLQSFVLSPVTAAFGPTAAFNVSLTLAPVVSGWCMFLASRRLTSSWLAQVAAAVLWGFSPFVISSESFGHLDLAVLFFPPLLFVCLFDLCATDRRSPRVIGIWLGLLVVAQFFAGTELLAVTILMAVVGLVVTAALNPRRARERLKRIATGFGVAAGVAALVLAYPVWMLLAGPRHIVGAPWPGIAALGSEPGSIVNPGPAHLSSNFNLAGGYYGPTGPDVAYLGWPLLIFVIVSAFTWWRRRPAWTLVAIGVAAWLCSLGVLLLPFGSDSRQWWLPWQYVQHLPLVGSIGPTRFAAIVTGVLALLLALSIDGWLELARGLYRRRAGAQGQPGPERGVAGPGDGHGGRRRAVPTSALLAMLVELALAAAVVVAAVPIVRANTWPLVMHAQPIPAWFKTTARDLPSSSVVVVYPYPPSLASDALYWQATDDMAFRLVSGRAEIPGADGRHSEHLDPLGGSDAFLAAASFGFTIPAAPSVAQITQLRESFVDWHVNVVVIVARGRAPAWAAAVFTEAIGRLPLKQHGALAWYSPGADWESVPPLRLSSEAVKRCSGDGYSQQSMETAPACVMAAGAAAAP